MLTTFQFISILEKEKQITYHIYFSQNFNQKQFFFSILRSKIEMGPLFTTQRVLIWLCLCPAADSSMSKWTRIVRHIFPLLLFAWILSAIADSLCFIIKFKSINVEATLFTFVEFVVYIGLIYIMAIAFFSRRHIAALLGQLTKIYDASLCWLFYNCFFFQFMARLTSKSFLIFFFYLKLKMQTLIRMVFWHKWMMHVNEYGTFSFESLCHAVALVCLWHHCYRF